MFWLVVYYALCCWVASTLTSNIRMGWFTFGFMIALLPIVGIINVAYHGPKWLFWEITGRNRFDLEFEWVDSLESD